MSPILFNLHGEYLKNEVLSEVENFKIHGRIFIKSIFVNDTAIVTKTQQELLVQDVVNILVDINHKK